MSDIHDPEPRTQWRPLDLEFPPPEVVCTLDGRTWTIELIADGFTLGTWFRVGRHRAESKARRELAKHLARKTGRFVVQADQVEAV